MLSEYGMDDADFVRKGVNDVQVAGAVKSLINAKCFKFSLL